MSWRQLRVLHVIPSLAAVHGGPSRAMGLFERALDSAGVQMEVATTDDAGPGMRLTHPAAQSLGSVTCHVFPKRSEFYKFSPALGAWLLQHAGDYDLLHIHALFSFSSIAAGWAARRAGVPYIIRPLGTLTRYGMEQRRPWLKMASLRYLEGPLLREAAAVHFTSSDECDEAAVLGIPMRGVVLPLAVDAKAEPERDALFARFPTLRTSNYVLFLSRIDPKKNIEALLAAVALLLPTQPDIQLALVGDGEVAYVAQLKELAASLGISSRLVWTGFLDGGLKAAVLSDATMFVLPSFSENFGIAAAEALLAGLPCVLGRGVAIAADVERFGAGRAVDPNAASTAQALAFYLTDSEARAAAGSAARLLATTHYSVDAMGTKLVDLYTALTMRRAAQDSADFLTQVTPVVLTYNESPNLPRTLARLTWSKEVLVVDSGSDDGTLEVIQRFPNVRVVIRRFDTHANQWNFACTESGVRTPWVLALDADYVLTPQLIDELAALNPGPEIDGYKTRFRYCVFGKPLRGTLYPPVTTLFRLGKGSYVQDGHTQRLALPGVQTTLQACIDHDDRKPLSRWLWAQDRYAALEVELLLSKPTSQLRIQDRLRKWIVVTPWLVPLYCLTVGRGLLDGWPGIFYALQRGVAEAVLSLKLLEANLRARARREDAA